MFFVVGFQRGQNADALILKQGVQAVPSLTAELRTDRHTYSMCGFSITCYLLDV